MPRRKSVKITNPKASRLPRQLGEFGKPAPVEPISAKPKARPGEVIRSSEHVRVTASERTQLPKGGNF